MSLGAPSYTGTTYEQCSTVHCFWEGFSEVTQTSTLQETQISPS